MAMRLADFVVNETGFASELGAEKYFDIVMRVSGIAPAVAVLVTTVQSLRAQGEGNLEAGFVNLAHHVRSLRRFGVPVVATINHFPGNETAELDAIAAECKRLGIASAFVEAFSKGGLGAVDLAKEVVAAIESNPAPKIEPAYSLDDSPEEKIRNVATLVYGAADVAISDRARARLAQFAAWGFAGLPVCIAKTQYSLTDNPKIMGAPSGWTLNVTDASLSAGAGFIVAVAGNMMLMPGLPSEPRALSIDVDAEGNIVGV